MSVRVLIEDSKGTGNKAYVKDNALMVSSFPAPPLVAQKTRTFRRYLTDDGLITGDENMLVDGSSTPVDFSGSPAYRLLDGWCLLDDRQTICRVSIYRECGICPSVSQVISPL